MNLSPPLELVPPLFNEIQISGDLVYDVILGAPQARKFCDFGPLNHRFLKGKGLQKGFKIWNDWIWTATERPPLVFGQIWSEVGGGRSVLILLIAASGRPCLAGLI